MTLASVTEEVHPCYNEEAYHHFARIHLPVAPACNVQCNYCNRLFDCPNECRPGVTSRVLTPEEAAHKVGEVLARVPQLTVVGIAGPGDPLANAARTFKTFDLIKSMYPDLLLCLSTNGLKLREHLPEIMRLGISHVTVTINAIDPSVGARIYSSVTLKGARLTGEEAAAALIGRQLTGARSLTDAGVRVKVNTVLIPGVNDAQVGWVAEEAKQAGAITMNIIPFIPVAGTPLQGFRSPTCDQLIAARAACEQEMPQMRHCRQCRADALGLLSDDLVQEFEIMAPLPAPELRLAREHALEEAKRRAADRRKILDGLAGVAGPCLVRVAVATKGGGLTNQHFGHAREFLVYEAGDGRIKLIDIRPVSRFCYGTEECGDSGERLEAIVKLLADCAALVCCRIGLNPARRLEAAGIVPIEAYDYIEKAVAEATTSLKPALPYGKD